MVLENWGEAERSARGLDWYSLPQDYRALVEPYIDRLEAGEPFVKSLESVIRAGADTALIERDYIDADYRDEFKHYYAQTFRFIPDRSQRLHFFAQRARYLGFVGLRPILGRPVCRTLLSPEPGLAPYVSCQWPVRVSPYGFRFRLRAFPFLSQDSQYGVCAHAAIWMVAHYFHLRFQRPRYFMSDIVASAAAHHDTPRSIPSGGLTERQITAVLHDLGMPVVTYVPNGLPGDQESLESIICRYLDSGLPVIVLGAAHAAVVIGYGRITDPAGNADGGLFFVLHDDARGPYLVVDDLQEVHGEPWTRLVAPLPGRIYLAGEAAHDHARLVLVEEARGLGAELADVDQALDGGRLRLRSYVTEIASYKHRLRSRGLPRDVVSSHALQSASHWVWVVELQDARLAAR
jgi:hypothetical protein